MRQAIECRSEWRIAAKRRKGTGASVERRGQWGSAAERRCYRSRWIKGRARRLRFVFVGRWFSGAVSFFLFVGHLVEGSRDLEVEKERIFEWKKRLTSFVNDLTKLSKRLTKDSRRLTKFVDGFVLYSSLRFLLTIWLTKSANHIFKRNKSLTSFVNDLE